MARNTYLPAVPSCKVQAHPSMTATIKWKYFSDFEIKLFYIFQRFFFKNEKDVSTHFAKYKSSMVFPHMFSQISMNVSIQQLFNKSKEKACLPSLQSLKLSCLQINNGATASRETPPTPRSNPLLS